MEYQGESEIVDQLRLKESPGGRASQVHLPRKRETGKFMNVENCLVNCFEGTACKVPRLAGNVYEYNKHILDDLVKNI